MRNITRVVAGALTAALVAAAVFGPATVYGRDGMDVIDSAPDPAHSTAQPDVRLPLQQALANALGVQGAVNGFAPADVQFHSEVQVAASAEGGVADGEPARSYSLKGTTIVTFDSPQQAGLDAWPAIIVSEIQRTGATGEVLPGDYSDLLRESLAQQLPGIWDVYEFGQEPRRYTFTEEITVHDREASAAAPYAASSVQVSDAGDDVLFGFATSGPDWDYTLGDSWETCVPVLGCVTAASARVGFALDWEIGMSLPVNIEQSAASPMVLGSNPISVTMRGLDWTPEKLSAQPYDLAGDDEFVLSAVAFAGAQATIAGIRVLNAGFDGDFYTSESFGTPMGKGETFPIPKQIFDASTTGLEWGVSGIMTIGMGLSIDPVITTDGVTANWAASQEGEGSGTLHYTALGVPQEYGSVTGVDKLRDVNQTSITLDDLRYTFQSFALDFGACPEFNLIGFGPVRGCAEILREVSLESMFGGLYVPPFDGEDLALTQAFGVDGTYWAYLPALRERQQSGR